MTKRRRAPKAPKDEGQQPPDAAAPRRRKEDFEADALRREVLGIAVLAASVCLMLALASFHPEDVAMTGAAARTGQTHNLIGPVGAFLADILLRVLGIGAFLLPVTLALPGVLFLAAKRVRVRGVDAIGYPVLVVAGAMLAHLLMAGKPVLGHDAGGLVGATGAEVLRALFGLTGAYILLYAVMALTFVVTTRISLVRLTTRAAKPIAGHAVASAPRVKDGAVSLAHGARSLPGRFAAWRAERAERKAAEREAREALELAEEEQAPPPPKAKKRAPEPRGTDEQDRLADEALAAVKARVAAERGLPEAPAAEPKGRATKRRDPEPPVSSEEFSLGRPALPADDGFRMSGTADSRPVRPVPVIRLEPPPATRDVPVLEAEDVDADFEDPLDREAFEPGDTVAAPALRGEPRRAAAPRAQYAQPAENPIRPVVKERAQVHRQDPLPIQPEPVARGEYQLPPLHLLDFERNEEIKVDPEFLQQQADRLVEALETYRIQGRVTEIHPGPVVTMFEFEPAPGVRISKIASLADDLAMALKAEKVRIVAPIPGKGVVGFEVPNRSRETVYLKEIIEDAVFRSKKNALPMALGKDIAGLPSVADLAKMPHLLVAGTTGSGKSVGVNGMITSLLYHATPEEVRFIMVDPKMLELSIYEGIPHLLLPVVTDPKKAAMALKWAVDEMERRYAVMKDAGVRDIRGYNKKVAEWRGEAIAEAEADAIAEMDEPFLDENGDELPSEPQPRKVAVPADLPTSLPYIVVVIDEFADLMMVAGKEVEYCVARIAQKARAAGIHLILATQRPSTDVITGVIKANFPTRIAFQVSSGIDSRTILSTNGAENLLGKGDMLFMPPGTSRLQRVHGAFVSEEEIHKVVEFVRQQGEPDYLDESVLASPDDEDEGGEADTGDLDEAYEEAVRVVYRDGRASTSHLQRRMSLGYNRAARIIDQMERDGLVGPGEGAKPRQIHKHVMAELIARWDGSVDF